MRKFQPSAHLAGALAVVAILAAGCGGAGASPEAPRQAIALAAATSQRLTSFTATETVTLSRPGPAVGRFGMSMRLAMQLKPTLLASADATMTGAGHRFSIREIVTRHAIYMNVGALGAFLHTRQAKPWVEISLAKLAGRTGFAAMFKKLGQGQLASNPLGNARFFAAATHLRRVGASVVDGVPTTEYSGVLKPSALVKFLPAAQRAAFGTAVRMFGHSSMPFEVWIDGQHHIRMLTMRLSAMSMSMLVKVKITSVNKPVTIKLPPASQVTIMRIPRF